jgi:DNA-binding NarL/FixJ family response regulator
MVSAPARTTGIREVMNTQSLRVLLADDHALVRAGLRELLQKLPGVEVVGEAADGRETLALVKSQQPDLVLLDISMKGLNGLEAAEHIAREFPAVKFAILSMHKNEEYALRALRIGACGYIIKDAAVAELERALQHIQKGGTYLSPAISQRVLDTQAGHQHIPVSSLEQLTPRQREILQLIAEGQNTKEIAHALAISIKTVETHRAQLMERLRIHDVPSLVLYAVRAGVVTTD